MNSRRQMGYLMAATGAVLALGSLAVGSFTAQATSGDDAHHVTVCHATHSESNPYVPVTVDVHSLGSGHLGRSGTIWYSGAKAAGVVWGDIVPAVAGITRGQNVAEGHYYLEHDCEKPPSSTSTTLAPSTSTTLDSSCRDDRYAWIRTSGKSDDGADDDECAVVTTTTTPPAETTTLPAETTTTLPAETTTLPADTTTTLPVDTTTSTTLPVDTTTSTTLPVDTTTTLSGDTTTTVGAADSTTTTVDQGVGGPTTTVDQGVGGPTTTKGSHGGGGLPVTGVAATLMLFLGLALLAIGGVFVVMTRRLDQA